MYSLGTRKRTITIALIIGVALIGGAYFFSGHHLSSGAQMANAESSQALLQTYAAKDSDNDGLPDWEEALYGTDPNNAHSVRSDLTDSQAVAQGLVTPRYNGQAAATTSASLAAEVPGTAPAASSLTDQFSKLFFNNYMATRGSTPPSAADMQTFVQNAVVQLEQTEATPDAFSASDMKVSGSGAAALATYAAAADAAFTTNAVSLPYDELTYFSDAVEKNDASALKNLQTISQTYIATAQAFAKIPAPSDIASQHLALTNAMARLGTTIADLAAVNDDPIRAMLGLEQYPVARNAYADSLSSMDTVFARENVNIATGTPGSLLLHLMNVATSLSTTPAATTP